MEKDSTNVVPAARYDTAWNQGGELFLRYESDAKNTLLFSYMTTSEALDHDYAKFGHKSVQAPTSMPKPVYRFRPEATRLDLAEEGAWDRASGEVVGVQYYVATPFALKNDSLTYSGRVVRTRGRTVQSVAGSPDSKWVAVLSVDGRRWPSLMPFIGRGRVMGTRYHQFFSRVDGKQVGETVHLPFDDKFDTSTPCWSADARFLVYPETSLRYLAIIEAPDEIAAENNQ